LIEPRRSVQQGTGQHAEAAVLVVLARLLSDTGIADALALTKRVREGI
jgi:hypothetical protein